MNEKFNKRFGGFLKALRIIRHVKRTDLAEYLCLDIAILWDIEHGNLECPVEYLIPLSNIFQISIRDLLMMRITQWGNSQPS